MQIEYLTNFEVKYKLIEEELKEKIKSRNLETDDDYTVEDIENICDDIYRHELMSVFGTNTIDDEKIYITINKLWILLNEKMGVREILKKVLEKMKMKKFINIDLKDELIFSSLFCYELFEYMHKFLNVFLNEDIIDETIIENMITEIEKY